LPSAAKDTFVSESFVVFWALHVISIMGCGDTFCTPYKAYNNVSNIDQFSNFFHCQNREKIRNNTVTKDPIAPQVLLRKSSCFKTLTFHKILRRVATHLRCVGKFSDSTITTFLMILTVKKV